MSEEIAHLVVAKAVARDIRELAVGQGMVTMREDGLQKAASGETSVEEILRAIG